MQIAKMTTLVTITLFKYFLLYLLEIHATSKFINLQHHPEEITVKPLI